MRKAKIDPTTAMLESARRAAERDEAAKEKGSARFERMMAGTAFGSADSPSKPLPKSAKGVSTDEKRGPAEIEKELKDVAGSAVVAHEPQEPAAAKEEPSAAPKRRAKSSGRVATTIYLDAETKRNIDRIILERKWAGETDASMALYIREAVAKQLAEDLAE